MNKKVKNYTVIGFLAPLVIAVGLSSCNTEASQDNLTPAPTATATPVVSSKAEAKTQIDQKFIELMIPHHQGAVEMAEMALTKAKRPEIKKLAESIIQDQKREIQQMQDWYKQWYGKEIAASSSIDHSAHQGMMSMDMMGMDMQALKNAADFDKEFIKQMIPHHQSALMMAEMVLDTAENAEIRNLAKSIIESQNAEIKQMQQWQQAWK
ncbi:DUF305 domain-containing protein [Microcoleus sp. FACHB-672]|uniref:DUF305 domain-containing protein n=1 Tax=Microcoleus sp. FACHB-672 TaxID=2692825 RepID=UPI001686716E|nr:DUF305 domain-containing protein [Microcoleus sp. FACHB-672]MBD2041889.1 DUF305 domain-containing protein [Microcoleus sp. FACHB-672]